MGLRSPETLGKDRSKIANTMVATLGLGLEEVLAGLLCRHFTISNCLHQEVGFWSGLGIFAWCPGGLLYKREEVPWFS